MTNREWETDEDRMMHQLHVHKNFIGWVIDRLEEEGISCSRTTGDDRKGDILVINERDVPRVKEIIRQIQNKYNS
jgi:transcription initiation factor IIE alpha subunit